MSKRLRDIEENIIQNANLQIKAFQVLLNYRSNKINRNILEIPEDRSDDAVQILNNSRPFRNLNLPVDKLKIFYNEAIKMKNNPELIQQYEDIKQRALTDVENITELRPKRQLTSWFERFTQNQTILPVYQFEPSYIHPDILRPTTEKQMAECRQDIVNSIMDGEILSTKCLAENLIETDAYDPQSLNMFQLATNINGVMLRPEIMEAVENFEQGNTSELNKADIPLYFVVIVGGEERGHHMVLYILCDNRAYTIGLGYYDKLQGKHAKLQDRLETIHSDAYFMASALYSPDHVLILDREMNYANSIIDIGILRRRHTDTLQNYLSQIKTIHVSYKYEEDYETLKLGATLMTGTKPIYSKISNRFFVDNYANCTSFITHIFPHVSCKYVPFLTALQPDVPKFCGTRPRITTNDIDVIFEYFLSDTVESTQQLIQYLKQRETLTHRGGKRRRTRRRRSRITKTKTKTKSKSKSKTRSKSRK